MSTTKTSYQDGRHGVGRGAQSTRSSLAKIHIQHSPELQGTQYGLLSYCIACGSSKTHVTRVHGAGSLAGSDVVVRTQMV